MSNHDFDLLAKAAFNETSPEEDRLIEEWLANDAEAQQAKLEFDGLREGLRSLADVPECQLSNERLRDAILSQGVKPKNSAFQGWKWAVPTLVAACATVFAVSYFRAPTVHQSDLAVNSAPLAKLQQNQAKPATDLGPVASNLDTGTKPIASLDSQADLNTASKSAQNAMLKAMANGANQQQDTVTDVSEVHETTARSLTSRNAKAADRSKADPAIDFAKLVAADLANATVTNTTEPTAKMALDSNTSPAADSAAMKDANHASPQVVVLGSSLQPDTRAQGAVEIQDDEVVFGG